MPRKLQAVVGLALTAFLAVTLVADHAAAKARNSTSADPVFQNDGNFRVPITTQCISTSWRAVVDSTTRQRKISLIAVGGASTGGVCLSSGPTNLWGCGDTTPGYELIRSSDTYEDSVEATIYCKSRAGTQQLKGFVYYDDRDATAE